MDQDDTCLTFQTVLDLGYLSFCQILGKNSGPTAKQTGIFVVIYHPLFKK